MSPPGKPSCKARHAFRHGFDFLRREYTQLLNTFTKDKDATASYTVKTKAELDALLKDETFNKADKLQLVELIMLADDAPAALSRQTELGGKTNKYGDPETV